MLAVKYFSQNTVLKKLIFNHNSFDKCIKSFCTSNVSFADTTQTQASSSTSSPKNASSASPNMKDEGEQFRYLLRNSNFINMGNPENKIVAGKVFHVVKDDLYIDFGWKFYCVCPRPSKSGRLYVRGTEVLLKLKDLECSTKFLGMEKDITLLEADASIVKLTYSPVAS